MAYSKEIKTCQNCKNSFVVEPKDFAFYENIQVSPPTWCPECRMVRRMTWKNYRTWYRRKCDGTGKNILSIYHPDTGIKVYDTGYWWSDAWDPTTYGKDLNLSSSFFRQFADLYKEVPHICLDKGTSLINCDFCNTTWHSKNCYLCVTTGNSEDCYYSTAVVFAKSIFDSHFTIRSENCFQCVDCYDSFNIKFGQNVEGCMDSSFLFDCKNCSNCFGGMNLRNKQYHIFNTPYTQEEYREKIKQFDTGSLEGLRAILVEFERLKLSSPHRYAIQKNCINVIGNNVRNSKNCDHCFDIEGGLENCKYISYGGLGVKESYDGFDVGTNAELLYECISAGDGTSHARFSMNAGKSNIDITYCDSCFTCSHLFGCVGLRNKQYCILNKQYTKEKYETLLPKLIEKMKRDGEYGEFFPTEMSPFAYNETVAQEYFTLGEAGAKSKGFRWRNPEPRNYQITKKLEELPDNIKDAPDSITNEIIECSNYGSGTSIVSNCTTAFKIIPRELDFYRKIGVPLPRLCPNCRNYERLKKRNPIKLWRRNCAKCNVEIETSYAPERPEIIYCEKCYNNEVA